MKKRQDSIALFLLLAVVGSGIGFLVSVPTGIFALILCAAFLGLYAFLSIRQRRRVAALSEVIDRVLHGQQTAFISQQQEGELSILSSEISKMTLRLKEQTDLLRKDKQYLTDAIADISHQMRTPLTSMNLLVSMLAEDTLTYERRLELARQLKQQLERTQWLVETLLKMSKIDAGTVLFAREPVSVGDLIQKAVEPLQVPMELRGQTLTVQANDETFLGDREWSAEALGNLLKNAIEHTPAGGEINVTALETALFTGITVEDNGGGFAPEDIPHLFERFYKGKNALEGSIGIGLALSRMIITQQNGTITAENTGQGARFTVKFYKTIV